MYYTIQRGIDMRWGWIGIRVKRPPPPGGENLVARNEVEGLTPFTFRKIWKAD
jgi:hypothetical protein